MIVVTHLYSHLYHAKRFGDGNDDATKYKDTDSNEPIPSMHV